jgi:hypothetical protein
MRCPDRPIKPTYLRISSIKRFRECVLRALGLGFNCSQIARESGVNRKTIYKVRDELRRTKQL